MPSPRPKYIKVKKGYCSIRRNCTFQIFRHYGRSSIKSLCPKSMRSIIEWPVLPLPSLKSRKGIFIAVFSTGNYSKKRIPGFVGAHKADKAVAESEGYILKIDECEILIMASSCRGIYYGLTTLAQFAKQERGRLRQVLVKDFPSYPVRGIQVDLSRGRILKPAVLKRMIQWTAGMKGNSLTLYIEPHVISWKKHPSLKIGHDVLEPEQIIKLDSFAKKYYVELMPGFQTLSHMEVMLSYPQYAGLSETFDEPTMICPTLKASRRLLDDFFDELCPMFSTKLFNAGFDECTKFERSLQTHPEKSPADIYIDHLKWVNSRLKAHGKQTMAYADALWRHKPSVLRDHPEKAKNIPNDIIWLNWNYEPQKSYPSMEALSKRGFRQIVLSGALDSRRIFPRIKTANRAVGTWLKHIKNRPGIMGLIATSWGNGHNRNFPENSLYHFAYALDGVWQGNPSEERDFRKKFGELFFGLEGGQKQAYWTKIIRMLGRTEDKEPLVKYYVPWRNNYRRISLYYHFWFGDSPLPRFDGRHPWVLSIEGHTTGRIGIRSARELEVHGKKILSLTKKIRTEENRFLVDRYEHAARETVFIGQKLRFRKLLQKVRAESEKPPSRRKLGKKGIKDMIIRYRRFYSSLGSLKQNFIALWNEDSLPENLCVHNRLHDQLLYYHGTAIKELEYLASNWDKPKIPYAVL